MKKAQVVVVEIVYENIKSYIVVEDPKRTTVRDLKHEFLLDYKRSAHFKLQNNGEVGDGDEGDINVDDIELYISKDEENEDNKKAQSSAEGGDECDDMDQDKLELERGENEMQLEKLTEEEKTIIDFGFEDGQELYCKMKAL